MFQEEFHAWITVFNEQRDHHLPWKGANKAGRGTLYSIQRGGVSSDGRDIRTEFPQIHSLLDMDFSFLDHHYAPALNLMPEKYQHFTTTRLQGYVEKMTSQEVAKMKDINLYPKP